MLCQARSRNTFFRLFNVLFTYPQSLFLFLLSSLFFVSSHLFFFFLLLFLKGNFCLSPEYKIEQTCNLIIITLLIKEIHPMLERLCLPKNWLTCLPEFIFFLRWNRHSEPTLLHLAEFSADKIPVWAFFAILPNMSFINRILTSSIASVTCHGDARNKFEAAEVIRLYMLYTFSYK